MEDQSGLDAIHNVLQDINDQDENIWRQSASRKCLKAEIKKLEEETKGYEIQIDTLKSSALYKNAEEVSQLLEDEMNQQVQTLHQLSLHINSKNAEIEWEKADIKSWDEKYKEVILELKLGYEERIALLEWSNATYKELRQCEASEKSAMVAHKRLKAAIASKENGLKKFREIKRKILHTSGVNLAKTYFRQAKDSETNIKLKMVEKKKAEMIKKVFEAQQALKRQPFGENQRTGRSLFCNMETISKQLKNFNNSVGEASARNSVQNEFSYGSTDLKKRDFAGFFSNPKIPLKNTPVLDINTEKDNLPSSSPFIEEIRPSPHKKVNIISNNVVLPPLKSILKGCKLSRYSSNRSVNDSSFNQSLTSQQNSQNYNNSQKMYRSSQESNFDPKESSKKLSQPKEMENKLETMKTFKLPQASGSDFMTPQYLKNLKFTTRQPSQMKQVQTPMKAAEDDRYGYNNLNEGSILEPQGVKRKLTQNVHVETLQTMKKDRNVNFASPLQEEQANTNQSSDFQNKDMSFGLNTSSNMNMSGFPGVAFMGDYTEQMSPPRFNFSHDATQLEEEKVQAGSKSSMFQEAPASGGTFGFSFGGSSKSNNYMF